jgi:hypothetical protein
MGKATLVLVTIAALGFGLLVGYSLVDDEQEDAGVDSIDTGAMILTGGAPAFRYLKPDDADVTGHDAESGAPFANGENFVGRDSRWNSEVREIELTGDSRVEYKVFMSQGDSFIFNWQVEGEEIYYDFHAHDDAFGEEFFTRYDDGRATGRSGSIVAAYDGQHGWYWQNLEPDDVTLTLEVAGFYDEIREMDLREE